MDGTATPVDGGPPAAGGRRPRIRRARWTDLDPLTLHDLVRLRFDVFVVEQECPYPELDGRDVHPTTEHLWLTDAHGPAAYLRVLAEPDGGLRIGRVCTRVDARGRGLAGLLMDDVLTGSPGTVFVLDAQIQVAGLYTSRGFVMCGPEYLQDGIPHIPMRRVPSSPSPSQPRG